MGRLHLLRAFYKCPSSQNLVLQDETVVSLPRVGIAPAADHGRTLPPAAAGLPQATEWA